MRWKRWSRRWSRCAPGAQAVLLGKHAARSARSRTRPKVKFGEIWPIADLQIDTRLYARPSTAPNAVHRNLAGRSPNAPRPCVHHLKQDRQSGRQSERQAALAPDKEQSECQNHQQLAQTGTHTYQHHYLVLIIC